MQETGTTRVRGTSSVVMGVRIILTIIAQIIILSEGDMTRAKNAAPGSTGLTHRDPGVET
jgi:hypothetical protein